MASLVTMEQAKLHLGIGPVYDNDADIQFKVEQASAIILDFLKGRAHEAQTSAVIESSAVGSPTVITTVSPHTLVNGQMVFVSGHVDSVPPLAGAYVIANTAASSFTVAVALTTAGTGGIASVFWDDLTSPGQVQSAVLLMLTHLYEQRGNDMKTDEDVWQAISRLLMRSRDPAFA